MWKREKGIYYFKSDLPIVIGYTTKSADKNALKRNTIFLKQVHSDTIIDIDQNQAREGDGLYTKRRHVQLGIRIADCLPIYFFNLSTNVIGILHAGWRGTIKGISKNLSERVNRFKYIFGAAIGPECYKVGADIAQQFEKLFEDVIVHEKNSFFLDLKKANRQLLTGQEIGNLELCTCCEEDLASYRREGNAAGRDIAFIRRI